MTANFDVSLFELAPDLMALIGPDSTFTDTMYLFHTHEQSAVLINILPYAVNGCKFTITVEMLVAGASPSVLVLIVLAMLQPTRITQ